MIDRWCLFSADFDIHSRLSVLHVCYTQPKSVDTLSPAIMVTTMVEMSIIIRYLLQYVLIVVKLIFSRVKILHLKSYNHMVLVTDLQTKVIMYDIHF